MEQWQDAASRQVKLFANRLNELLSKGSELLRSELGVDLGLKQDLIPSWGILLVACTGLVLMVVLWASACRGLFKKRPSLSPVDDGVDSKRGVVKPLKVEETKKKKKKADKKSQPNGRAVAESHEEALVSEESVPHHQTPPPEVKAENLAEVKKSKKKGKQAVKETKTITADGKEPEQGTWETKVSNKEKREQRKKDKGSSDGSASPGGADTPVNNPPEPPKDSAPPAPANQKKKKGESSKVKAENAQKEERAQEEVKAQKEEKAQKAVKAQKAPKEEKPPKEDKVPKEEKAQKAVKTQKAVKVQKVEAPVSTVNNREVAAPAGVTDLANAASWKTSREPASLWRGEIDDSWTVIDSSMPTSEINMSFPGLGTANNSALDPSSDWNAPSEAWGNFEEPTPATAAAKSQSLPQPAEDKDEDENEQGEAASNGAAKGKKKKKKKKPAAAEEIVQGEEPEKEAAPAAPAAPGKKKKQQPPPQGNVAAVQPGKIAAAEARVDRQGKENKPTITQVPQKPTGGEPTMKQNNLPATVQQKKPEENETPKPAKKKKARKDT